MGFQLITDAKEARGAFSALKVAFEADALPYPLHKIGWQGGGGNFQVNWRGDEHLWGVFELEPPQTKSRDRFWILFGVNKPQGRSMLSITVEINPPHEGINRRVAGAFLRDSSGQLYLGHSGKIGGGRDGIGMSAFRQFYSGAEPIFVPQRRADLFIFGPIQMPGWIKSLSEYVHAVAEFKSSVRQ